ncbi:hypothetical protein BG015_000628 [Linnemannia schmuckeri]|uniref:Uncharacterized protein n=1 Tax=Linnemannia schmuckeri TaxID=64567 RepID=A0A9P5VE71_9FUNG|nr:hypothetical protein BG015_000628 [Linnemannia schmuckeri]
MDLEETEWKSSVQSEQWTKGLITLEEIVISEFCKPVPDETDIVAIAYSQNLKEFEAYHHRISYNSIPRFDKGWVELPFLTHLRIFISAPGLTADPQLFSNYPNVVSVLLLDETQIYQRDEIELCLPAHLSLLGP